MKIESITLHNYKCFEGTIHIDGLASKLKPNKRVVLFGGLNGAGKTTIFESLLLCLYGKRNTALIPSKGAKRESYNSYISSIVNNKARSKIKSEIYVEVELSDVEIRGVPQSMRLKRSWVLTDNKSSPIEKFEITDGEGQPTFISEFTSEDDYDSFIEELIPYDVSQFFFFDGEKIQEFVRDEDAEFARSLEQVLGISDYRTLYDDIKTVRARLVTANNQDADVLIDLKNIESKMAECEKTINQSQESIDDNNADIHDLENRISEIDIETRRITRIKAETLDEYRNQRDNLISEKSSLEQSIFETIKDSMPFVVTAQLSQELLKQLEVEMDASRIISAQKALEPKINDIIFKLFYNGLEAVPMLTNKQKEFYADKLKNILFNTLGEIRSSIENINIIHNITSDDIDRIKNRINDSIESITQMTVFLKRLQEIDPILSQIQKTERQATTDPETENLYRERGRLEEQINTKRSEIIRLQTEIDKNQAEINSLKVQHGKLEERAETTAKRKKQIEYCRKISEVIEDFSNEFRKQRAENLEEYTFAMWKKLAHKQDLINRITVNPDRQFSVDLYDSNDKLLDKTKLSAGEKELLAISLISALIQIANRSLPIIIDTPLGRLDTEHRSNIALHFFPNTSHQVILLSTDTEIIGNDLLVIQPYVCKYYNILSDKNRKSSTVIPDEYFNKK